MAETPDLETLMARGQKLYAAGHTAASALAYREALALAPDDPTVRLRYASAIWHGEQRAEEALQEVRDLARRYPQAAVFDTEAKILNSLGRFDEAAKAAERALEIDPCYGSAWLDLSIAAPPDRSEALVDALKIALERPDLGADQRRDMHFAMAAFLRKLDRPDQAFSHTVKANDQTQQAWNVEREAAFHAEMKALFTPALLNRLRGAGHADGRMIFILGMPRSGTTLLERMLLAHPDIGSAGETTTIGRMLLRLREQCGNDPELLAKSLTPSNLRAMATAYLEEIDARMGSERPYRIIDKMPANYLFLPAISLMLPRAHIVHVTRHPLDTGLSCYEAGFSFGLDYAARLDTLGIAYRLYADLTDHWQTQPGARVFRLRYEDLVQSTDITLKRLLAEIELPWDQACLEPARDGMIKTASLEQARGAVNTRSIGRWRAFRDQLHPMITAMGGLEWAEARAAADSAAVR